jgi:hypothetical protein
MKDTHGYAEFAQQRSIDDDVPDVLVALRSGDEKLADQLLKVEVIFKARI